jgi:hypothetical protein
MSTPGTNAVRHSVCSFLLWSALYVSIVAAATGHRGAPHEGRLRIYTVNLNATLRGPNLAKGDFLAK